jgi:6-phosphogluconate dehydrogenase (decarboxylating)
MTPWSRDGTMAEGTTMQIGLTGLGRMGANMSRRWLDAGHAVVGYARHAETVDGLVADGAISAGASSLIGLVGQLTTPRVLWLMVPAAAVAPVLTTALDERFTSRGEADFADRVLSAMRFGFGGHLEGKG